LDPTEKKKRPSIWIMCVGGQLDGKFTKSAMPGHPQLRALASKPIVFFAGEDPPPQDVQVEETTYDKLTNREDKMPYYVHESYTKR
jgi:hypothetical protein